MAHRFRGFLGVAAAFLLVAFVAGCTTTRTPGEQIDDNAIQTEVKAKLTADRFSNIVNIDINVTNGVVSLAGEVPNPEVKAEAEREAMTVKGVKKVNNNLQVSSPPKN